MIKYTYKIDTHDGRGLRKLNIKPIQGHSDLSKLNEELDTGFLTLILKNREPLPIMSYLIYEIEDETDKITKEFYIGSDDVVIASKQKKYYEHNIELIELTKRLEKQVVGTVAFTQPLEKGKTNYYITDCINRVLSIAELKKDVNDGTSYYYGDKKTGVSQINSINKINARLYDFLKTIPAPQLVFTNATFREVLDGILKYVNGVTRLKKAKSLSDETIKIFELQNRTEITFNVSSSSEYKLNIYAEQNIENFVILWGDGTYLITDLVQYENYEFINYYNVGEYTIKLPDNKGYSLKGNSTELLCCLTNVKENKNAEITAVKIIGPTKVRNYAFYNCDKIATLKLDDDIETIYDYAFYGCNSLTHIYLPYNLSTIRNYAFYIEEVSESADLAIIVYLLTKEVPTIYQYSFNSNIYTTIANDEYRKVLFIIPKKLEEEINLDNRWQTYFSGTDDLPTLNFSNDETVITIKVRIPFETNLFLNIVPTKTTDSFPIDWGDGEGIKYYSVEENVPILLEAPNAYEKIEAVEPSEETMGSPAIDEYKIKLYNSTDFYFESWELNDAKMPSVYGVNLYVKEVWLSNKKIGNYAFANLYSIMDNLENIQLEYNVEEIGEHAFEKVGTSVNENEIKLSFPPTLKTINQYAFYGAFNFRNKNDFIFENVFPKGLETIEKYAFAYSYLPEIELQTNIQTIGENAFYGVSLLDSVYIPINIGNIQYNAFGPNLKIYINDTSYNENWSGSFTDNPNNVSFISYTELTFNEINMDSFSDLKRQIENKQYYEETKGMNIEDYSTKAISFSKNLLNEEKYDYINHIAYPYNYNSDAEEWGDGQIDTFGKVTSPLNEYAVTDTNFGILTQFPIQSVINAKIPIYFNDVLASTLWNWFRIPPKYLIDFTNHILEEEAFNSLSERDRKSYFYYKKGTNFIHMGNTYQSIIFEHPALKYMLEEEIAQLIEKKKGPNQNYFYVYGAIKTATASGDNADWSQITIQISDGEVYVHIHSFVYFPQTIGYLIKYIPLTDSLITAEKIKTEDININTSSIVNQENRVLSFSNFTNTMFSTIQRLGNKKYEVTLLHYALKDLMQIGDYKDGYVVTTAEYIYYDNYIIGKYILDKDYNRLSSFMGINADIRQFEIPSGYDTYERNCYYNTYVEISYENNSDYNFTDCKQDLTYYLVKTLCCNNTGAELNKIGFSVITYNKEYYDNVEIFSYFNNKQPFLLLETIVRGAKNSITFNFNFMNNLVLSVYTTDDTTFLKNLKEKIPYAIPEGDKKGFLRNLSFKLISNLIIDESDSYTMPLFFNENYVTQIFDSGDLLILKDPAERLKFTYQMHFIPKDKRIVLGNAFFENNYLVRGSYDTQYTEEEKLKCRLYKSNIKYGEFDTTKIKEGDITLISEYDQEGNGTMPYISWSFIDETNKNSADFYIQFKKDYLENELSEDTKTIILADEYNNIIMHIAYDVNDIDENGENYLYKPIYFNFKDKRSDIKYDY